MVIRQLEYALLQLTHQVDKLLMAVQSTLSEKLSMTIVGPNVLHNILRNISLCLSENYELIACTKFHNIHLYYELIRVVPTLVGTARSIKLIMEISLKTASQLFTLLRIIALPTRVLNDTFAVHEFDFDYFGLSHSQRDYILITASDAQRCSAGSIAVCPADKAFFDVWSVTRYSKFFFQTAAINGLCRRSPVLHYETPTFH
jgi:hypothetical protein